MRGVPKVYPTGLENEGQEGCTQSAVLLERPRPVHLCNCTTRVWKAPRFQTSVWKVWKEKQPTEIIIIKKVYSN